MTEKGINTPIEKSAYLSWYNDEINRYRDHEWQLASYSIGISTAIVTLAKTVITNNEKQLIISVPLIISFTFLLELAEIFTHARLNHFRERRELLLMGKNHIGKSRSDSIETPFFKGGRDTLYFCAFFLIPLSFGIGAAYVLSTI